MHIRCPLPGKAKSIDKIADLLDILNNVSRLMTVIKEELLELKESFGDERRTEIIAGGIDLTMEDLITYDKERKPPTTTHTNKRVQK